MCRWYRPEYLSATLHHQYRLKTTCIMEPFVPNIVHLLSFSGIKFSPTLLPLCMAMSCYDSLLTASRSAATQASLLKPFFKLFSFRSSVQFGTIPMLSYAAIQRQDLIFEIIAIAALDSSPICSCSSRSGSEQHVKGTYSFCDCKDRLPKLAFSWGPDSFSSSSCSLTTDFVMICSELSFWLFWSEVLLPFLDFQDLFFCDFVTTLCNDKESWGFKKLVFNFSFLKVLRTNLAPFLLQSCRQWSSMEIDLRPSDSIDTGIYHSLSFGSLLFFHIWFYSRNGKRFWLRDESSFVPI